MSPGWLTKETYCPLPVVNEAKMSEDIDEVIARVMATEKGNFFVALNIGDRRSLEDRDEPR